MIPDLTDTPDADDSAYQVPRGGKDFGNGRILLRAKDESKNLITGPAASAIREFLGAEEECEVKLKRWARFRLPNGQIARSHWKEKEKSLENIRMARNVKICLKGQTEIAEVYFYFEAEDQETPLALAALYSRPDKDLLQQSSGTVWSCNAPTGFTVFDTKTISAVVAMVPHEHKNSKHFFLVEKPGLEITSLAGYRDKDDEA
ncbi:hypothetical protein FB45DRAFT_759657 [Roridomyces roridus]|nr:hypothetical protein FB45DRAFT_759657 [Roridomyces roridus]